MLLLKIRLVRKTTDRSIAAHLRSKKGNLKAAGRLKAVFQGLRPRSSAAAWRAAKGASLAKDSDEELCFCEHEPLGSHATNGGAEVGLGPEKFQSLSRRCSGQLRKVLLRSGCCNDLCARLASLGCFVGQASSHQTRQQGWHMSFLNHVLVAKQQPHARAARSSPCCREMAKWLERSDSVPIRCISIKHHLFQISLRSAGRSVLCPRLKSAVRTRLPCFGIACL